MILAAMLLGFAEPLGALLAWGIFGNDSDPLALGIAFGVVGGIMINIGLKELLPVAFKYDPCDQLTTKCFVGTAYSIAFRSDFFD